MSANRKFSALSADIIQAVKFAWLDARGKRASREIGLTLMQAKRLALGEVSEANEVRALLALRERLQAQQAELARVKARIEERLYERAPEHLGGRRADLVEAHRLAAPRTELGAAQGREGADRG